MGGQQPVSAASIQLYAAGLTGNASAATPLLTTPVLTDSSGSFNITGDYTCPTNAAPVYLVATGGNPGLPGSVNNSALVLVDALGSCASLSSSTFILVNEVTTAAAAWALAPFAHSATQLGSTSTNLTGLNSAFLTAASLADSSTGVSPSSHAPSNAAINSAKIYSLANILATCVNSDGTSPCTSLFSAAKPPSTATPADTFQAALDIVSHPSNNVATLFNLIPTTPPFASGLSVAPPDWTLAIKFTGGGLNGPTGLGIDASGNIWVADYYGAASQFTSNGQPLFPNGITGNGLNHSYGLAIDAQNNPWIPNEDTPSSVNNALGSVTVLNPSGQSISGPNGFTSGALDYPVAVATDSNSTTWVINYGTSTVSLLSTSGTAISAAPGFGLGHLAFPVAIDVDANHNAWIANQSGNNITRISPDGTQVADFSCCNGASGIAVDQNANVWVANYYGNSISQITTSGTVVSNGAYTGGGITYPQGIAIDGAGSVWIANYRGSSITQLAGSTATTPGATLSPAAGWGPDARISLGFGLAIDATGSIWVTGFGDDSLTQFVGLATPIKTPRLGPPQLP
jgi:streptogramin lyase